MTDKQLKKLHRPQLLELMLTLKKEYDELLAENESIKKQLADTQRLLKLSEETLYGVKMLCENAGLTLDCEHTEDSGSADDGGAQDV